MHQIITTKDGSHSIYLPYLNEHYHSIHGAIQESQHVFIRNGLDYFLSHRSEICILEIGFGTGLNAFLSCIRSLEFASAKIEYTGLETYPLSEGIIEKLNYADLIEPKNQSQLIFQKLHRASWNVATPLTQHFKLYKIQQSVQAFQLIENYHLIYFDAFAPDKQAEMWTSEIFQKLFMGLKPGGMLVTYCAKGVVKRTLKSVGFTVETLQGPPGKREMIRAIKSY